MWRNGEAEEEEDNMDEDHIVKFVEIYLKKKGFKQAEIAFQEEVHKSNSSTANTYNNYGDLHSDSEFSKLILLFSRLSYYVRFVRYLSIVLWIWQQNDTSKRVEASSIGFVETMKSCTYEIFRSWEEFFHPPISRRWSLLIRLGKAKST
ncbi:uncharacterized protein LOC119997532 isoform X2 [Tripterygium wilfordii]|uniref:uncharacterized protein LOC119997532 isoform X2 n=1 Tax=Tripterygium wilfordii TaxID=458696 RepID=UPI0018F80018|nr:uncharacterized protein LOC119997532 isoform X2 [Tripterygium wilfordii]XP_038700555.1 uncharacterized protein LOC119997532 isoform X2 [Tripterygium wilfordii]